MTLFIDPLDKILMDFYLACWEKNEEGKTEIVNYSEWADKIRKLYSGRRFCGNPNCDGDFEIVGGGHMHPRKHNQF